MLHVHLIKIMTDAPASDENWQNVIRVRWTTNEMILLALTYIYDVTNIELPKRGGERWKKNTWRKVYEIQKSYIILF